MGTQSSDGFQLPRVGQDARSMSAASFATAKSVTRSNLQAPGSFTTDLRSTSSRQELPRYEYGSFGGTNLEDTASASERRQAEFRDRIDKEMKIKIGTENLLEALNAKKEKHIREQRKFVEQELYTSNRKIAQLKVDLEAEIQRSKEHPTSPRGRLSQLFKNAPLRSTSSQQRRTPDVEEDEEDAAKESESPSYVLAEILQALERLEMPFDYYVNHANELVELFKRHPSLKYDLAWSIFGLRMQMLLLSDSREVVAAGYRVMRYAIAERKSLQTIRSLQTDWLVILSLVKESKMRVEREQALKFVRAFLYVKDGTKELHPAVVRVVVAIADHADDQLRNIAILTLAEMLLKDPELVIDAGGISVLAEVMGNGTYNAPETLVTPILNLMDTPAQRAVLPSGLEFGAAFATLTEPASSHITEERLRSSSRVIAVMFKSWTGLMTLSTYDFLPVRSVVSALYICTVSVRAAITDLIATILHIQFPSWTSSFIGGRRLTTYGRVTNLKSDQRVYGKALPEDGMRDRNLVEHFIAVSLTVLLRQGLLPALLHAERNPPSVQLGKKTSVLLAEVLRMAGELLPTAWSAELQTLPGLFSSATDFNSQDRLQAASTVYEVDRINRMLYRSTTTPASQLQGAEEAGLRTRANSKTQIDASLDDAQIKQKIIDTGVASTVSFTSWDWASIQSLLDGPLQNPRKVTDLIGNLKLAHRLLGFLRPFKYRFSEVPNTKLNQRYIRAGCSLFKALLQSHEGARYLADNKLIPQVAECLAQKDWASGITAQMPIFSPDRLAETLAGGYFAFLGVMCGNTKGMQILERWRIINMFYHIVELKDRDDLIKSLLTQLDYDLDSHPRIILAKAMTAGSKPIRILSTRILGKYASMPVSTDTRLSGIAEWAIKLLVSQLYDPEIEVCEIAIKGLEEACNSLSSLEYVVKCRPALDHLGEIGAPLLLRFLSTSVGYHYLDGLDYITKEMDDWFLGRNDTYVTLVEAALARALTNIPERAHISTDDVHETCYAGFVPPHFYRELTRTAEGCELLQAKGHFEEFSATIEDFAMETVDVEIILKVKGCLWAVGNIGSMDLGAPFLEQTDVVKHIVQIAETSEVMSLRGTAFYVLGLISRSLHGQEILAAHGWDGTTNMLGESLGYSLPLDFGKLFLVRPHATAHAIASWKQQRSVTDVDSMNSEILKSITKLCNSVLVNKAVGELNHLKHAKRAPGFAKPALFKKAMVLLATRNYRIPQYRFVIDLFDKSVLRKIVLEEDSDDDSDMDDEDDEGHEGQVTTILAT